MIVDDKDVEIKKFKMYAENADSEQKIVELCKKYLKHKGIDVDHSAAARDFLASQIAPPKIETVYANPNDIHVLKHVATIDRYLLDQKDPNEKLQVIAAHQKRMVDAMAFELVSYNLVKFETYQDYACDQTRLYGYLKVWKGR